MRGSFALQSWLVSATRSEMNLNSSIKSTQMFIVLKVQFLHHERCVRSSMSHDDDDEISWFVIPKVKHLCLSKHFHTSLHNFRKICIMLEPSIFCFAIHALAFHCAHCSRRFISRTKVSGWEKENSKDRAMHIDGRSKSREKKSHFQFRLRTEV